MNIKALPDWLMRREKLCIAALLGHCGTHRTRVRLRSSFGRALHYPTFDDANEITESSANPARVHPGALGFGTGLHSFRLKMILFIVEGILEPNQAKTG